MKTAAVAVCSLLALAGCVSLRSGRPPDPQALSPAEQDFARALAYYADGLLREGEGGGDAAAPVDAFARAAELDPGEHRLSVRAALQHLQRQEPEKAVEVLERSCRASPDSLQARIDLAMTCQITGRDREARRHYARAVEMAPTNALLHVELARLDFRANRDGRAFQTLRRGLRQSPDRGAIVSFCATLGRQFIEAKDLPRAAGCFEFLAASDPARRREYHHVLGELDELQDRRDSAMRHYAIAVEGDNPLPDSLVRMAMIQLDDDPDRAVQTLLDASYRLPENVTVLAVLGCAYSVLDQFPKAVETFERARALIAEPDRQSLTPFFYIQYGMACERSGDVSKAEQVLEECLAAHPDTHEALNYLAYTWAELGRNLDKAFEYSQRSLELDPENGAYLDTLGWIYFRKQEYGKARALLLKAVTAMPEDPVISEHLGDVAAAMGDPDAAVSCWLESFLRDPASAAVAAKLAQKGIDVDALRRQAAP